jgi:outer membrane protein TolC
VRPGSGCSERLKGAQAELLAANWNRKAVITTLVSDVATAYFTFSNRTWDSALQKARSIKN